MQFPWRIDLSGQMVRRRLGEKVALPSATAFSPGDIDPLAVPAVRRDRCRRIERPSLGQISA
jgi:hypothetical protein